MLLASKIVPISVPQMGPRNGVNVQSHSNVEYCSTQVPLLRHGLLAHFPTHPSDTPYSARLANSAKSISLPFSWRPRTQPTKPSRPVGVQVFGLTGRYRVDVHARLFSIAFQLNGVPFVVV
ncbi:hypothetical protein BpHYR1_000897 [Brachionus plicatilis]|uniref:Uncharacterized protein n=1 Tax=Brachionus plicatilis TaxID=10195 RepID=A0A3M7SFS4_BRAPC|nr:hypothetical protein BpHYR1_000897 [Brachionus plicatilis]